MVSQIEMVRFDGRLTEDNGNNEGLNILCAGLIRVSRKISDIQAECSIVSKDTVEIYKRELD